MWSLTLVTPDTVETYFDSHVDLLQRRLQKHSDRLKMKAEEKIKDLSGDLLAENFEREFKSFKLKVCGIALESGIVSDAPNFLFLMYQLSTRMTNLAVSWQSAKVVRTREKVSFFFGVMTLLFSALMFGMTPQYVSIITLPDRIN